MQPTRPTLNAVRGTTRVSFHHCGDAGIGYNPRAGPVIACDGSEAADKRIARVLWNNPVTRHADAGYAGAIACANEQGLKLPIM